VVFGVAGIECGCPLQTTRPIIQVSPRFRRQILAFIDQINHIGEQS
jgi:hypothetical protein